METKKWLILLIVLMLSACRAENSMEPVSNTVKSTESSVTALVYDGEKRITLSVDRDNSFTMRKGLLSTTDGRQYLLVVHRDGFLPSYSLKTYRSNSVTLDTPKLQAFSEEKRGMAYISGMLTRASMGGKITFRSGLSRMGSGYKVHIFALDADNRHKKDFYVKTDKNGFFGIYVKPGRYRVEYGKREVYRLKSGENGIFLMSMVTMKD